MRLHRSLWQSSREVIFFEVKLGPLQRGWTADPRIAYIGRGLSAILDMFTERQDLIGLVHRITLDQTGREQDETFAEGAKRFISMFQGQAVHELDTCSLSDLTMSVCHFATIQRFRMRDIYVSGAIFALVVANMPFLKRLDICHCTMTDDTRRIERVSPLQTLVIEMDRHGGSTIGTRWKCGIPCRRLEMHGYPCRETMYAWKNMLVGGGVAVEDLELDLTGMSGLADCAKSAC